VPVVPVFFSGSSPICGHGRALRAATRLVILRERGWPALLETARLVILREVAGSTLAHGVTAGVDSATARGMTPLDGRPHEDAVASPQIGEEPFFATMFQSACGNAAPITIASAERGMRRF
jgi:hypothetical protein